HRYHRRGLPETSERQGIAAQTGPYRDEGEGQNQTRMEEGEGRPRISGLRRDASSYGGPSMPLKLIEDALGDPRNAAALALASDLAYLPESEGAAAFRDQLGMEARLISVGNTQVYIAANDDHIVAAFRGTEAPTSIDGLKDWLLTDAANLLIVPEGR